MNSNDIPSSRQRGRAPTDPMGYVFRRVSSMVVVVGVAAGLIGATLVESAGLPGPVAVGAGIVAFVAATSLATGLADGRLMPHRGRGSQ